jgi:hypothetical protein
VKKHRTRILVIGEGVNKKIIIITNLSFLGALENPKFLNEQYLMDNIYFQSAQFERTTDLFLNQLY